MLKLSCLFARHDELQPLTLERSELTDVHNNTIFSTGEGLPYYRGMSQTQPCRQAGVIEQHGLMHETSHPSGAIQASLIPIDSLHHEQGKGKMTTSAYTKWC